jgi:hypothetical protein
MQKFSEIKPLIKKYGEKIVLFTIFVDELNPKEYKDLEYLEERINTHIDFQGDIKSKIINQIL